MSIKFEILLSLLAIVCLLQCCSSPKHLGFLCGDRQIEIYVDGQYLGTGIVNYTVPKDAKEVTVVCKSDGEIVYQREYDAEDYNGQLIELQIPTEYHYSSGNSREK